MIPHHAPIWKTSAEDNLRSEQRSRSRRKWLILCTAAFTVGWITYCLWWGL